MTYQLFTVGYLPTVVVTSNRESGFDSGEGACEIATTSKEAAGAQITQLSKIEVVMINNNTKLVRGFVIGMRES